MSIPSIKTSKQQVFARKDILKVLSMQAHFKQSKINCNTIYWINAVKACFDEHTKNTKSNWQDFVLMSWVLQQAYKRRERQLVTITVTLINDNSSCCCYITGMMGCLLWTMKLARKITSYCNSTLQASSGINCIHTYLLCLIKPVTSNKLHWSDRFLHKAN